MIYDRKGRILWHKGRTIEGKTIDAGAGFCRNYIKESLTRLGVHAKPEIAKDSAIDSLSESAMTIPIKSLIISPLNSKYFLYIDSRTDQSFIESELMALKSWGEILAEITDQLMKNEKDMRGICGKSAIIKMIKNQALDYAMEKLGSGILYNFVVVKIGK